ncbi:hypothetical protein B9Z31_08605 [Limnohabitans sp. G3-2]|nr:hypothetical protein B9Z31_08605 [Limnohabitans sp. G3-2]
MVSPNLYAPEIAKDKLTIAIPSFNRAAMLAANLKTVAGALPSWIHILVVDNASELPIHFDQDLHALLVSRGVTFTIIRNRTNIGGGANILRCFEHVDTDWFLLCGDDDLIDPLRLGELRSTIDANPDAAFVKFSSRFHNYTSTIKATGVRALMDAPGDFNSLLFMSSYLFQRRLCVPFMRFGYLMNAAYAPHVEIALLAASKHPFVLSPVIGTLANEEDAAWSPVDVVLCAYYLTDSPLTRDERNAITRKIYAAHNVGRELLDIVSIQNAPRMKDEARFLRRKALRTHLFFGHGLKRFVALAALIVSPLFGAIGQRLLAYLYRKTTGRKYLRKFVARHAGL